MDPTVLAAKGAAIESYLVELDAFLKAGGPIVAIGEAAATQAGAKVGDPALVSQVLAITDWIAKAAGTTVGDPAAVARLAPSPATAAAKPVPGATVKGNPFAPQPKPGNLGTALKGLL